MDTSASQMWHCGLSEAVEFVAALIEAKGLVELKGRVKFRGVVVALKAGDAVNGKTPLVWLSAPNAAPNAPICGNVVGKHFSDAMTTMVP